MELCSTPRRGIEAPDPIDLIFKEKWGFGGIAPKRVRAVVGTDPANPRVLCGDQRRVSPAGEGSVIAAMAIQLKLRAEMNHACHRP